MHKKIKLSNQQITERRRIFYRAASQNYAKKKKKKNYAVGIVTPYMNLSKRKILMNAFFNSQFSYCSLIWLCHSRIINKKSKQTT